MLRASFQAKVVLALGRGKSLLSCSYTLSCLFPSFPQGLTNSEATKGAGRTLACWGECGVGDEGEPGGHGGPR